MKTELCILSLVVAVSGLVACGSEDGTSSAPPVSPTTQPSAPTGSTAQALTTVRGTFAEQSLALDNARAIAFGDDGSVYWTYLGAGGDFTLQLPVGCAYRIVFANELEGGGQVKIAHLTFETSVGVSEWFGANQAGDVELGGVSSTGEEGGSSGETPKGSAAGAGSGNVDVCLIWPSVAVVAQAKVGAAFFDAKAEVHAGIERVDDKGCSFWARGEGGLSVEGNVIWGASGGVDLGGGVLVTGGVLVSGGVVVAGGVAASAGAVASGGVWVGGGVVAGANVGVIGGIGVNVGIGGGVQTGGVVMGGVVGAGAVVEEWVVGGGEVSVGGTCSIGAACHSGCSCVAAKCEAR
jgi:hypothetical protein